MDDNLKTIRAFAAEWDRRVGSGSAFERQLTPESRKFYRMMVEEPRAALRVVLDGVEAALPGPVAPAGRNAHARVWPVALATAVGVIAAAGCCRACGASGWVALPVVGAVAAAVSAIAAGWAGRRLAVPVLPAARPEIAVDSAVGPRLADLFQRQLESVVGYVRDREQDAALGFDVTDSNSFGEWIQKFVDYANGNPDDHELRLLKSEFVSKLRIMGIVVYDKLAYDESGKPRLPERDSFRDERSADAEAFSVVRHAVVTSRRRLLAVGELA